MAYPINNDVLAMFQDDDRPHIARLTMGTTVIDESRISQGGLSVNRYSSTGEGAMVGACVAAEANILLDNHDGYFNSTVFVGQEILIEVGVVDDNDDPQYVPLGYFEIDQSPRKLSQIHITALDRMLFFEQVVDSTALSFPCTVGTLLSTICTICGVTRVTGQSLVNESYEITDYPETAQTYRDLLRWICEITGTNAYFRWDGKLVMGWYSDSSSVTLTTANRYESDTSEEAVSITGVKVIVGEEEYVGGTDAYNITIAQNPYITHDAQAVATALYTAIYPFDYKAFTATVMPMPHLYPMDGLTYVDKNGNSFFCAITDWTFKLNGNTALRGRGQTATQVTVGQTYSVSKNGADFADALNILRANIIRTAEVINQNMETLSQDLHGEYTALSSQFGQYQQETNAHFEATAEGITQNYDAIQIIQGDVRDLGDTKANNSSVANINTTVNQHSTYITQTKAKIRTGLLWYDSEHPNGVYGVAIGQVDDVTFVNNNEVMRRTGFYSTYTSEELAFYIGTQKVAYISNNKLFITWANVVDKIDLGRYTIDDEGSRGLTFKWRGNN